VLQRGSRNQRLPKVKGHAKEIDIREGRSTPEDRKGNDTADTNADTGVDLLGGKGLTELGRWVAKRHDDYIAFMKKVQHFIVYVLQEEKAERHKAHVTKPAVLGYDPKNG